MKLKTVPIVLLLSLCAPNMSAQGPRPLPPAPKPVEEIPAPDIRPPVSRPVPALASLQGPDSRRWAMFDGESWPSEKQMENLTNQTLSARVGSRKESGGKT